MSLFSSREEAFQLALSINEDLERGFPFLDDLIVLYLKETSNKDKL